MSEGRESVEMRARYDRARSDFNMQRSRTETARNALHYYWDDFRELEQEFLAVIDELRHTDRDQSRNLGQLQDFRIRLMTSLDGPYRHAVNELADALLASIGMQPGSPAE